MRLKKFGKRVGIGLMVLASSAAIAILVGRAVIGQNMAPLKPCLTQITKGIPQSNDRPNYVELASLEDKATESKYYVYSVGPMSAPGYWEPVIKVQSGICRVLTKRDDRDHLISEYVAQPIAKQLNKMALSRKIKTMGGPMVLQQELEKEAAAAKKVLYMPQETYDAMVEIGVKPPAKVKPIDYVPSYKDLEEDRH
jgi:hypothetical protein